MLTGAVKLQHDKDWEASSAADNADKQRVLSGENSQVENPIIDLQKVMLLPHMPSKFDTFIHLPLS